MVVHAKDKDTHTHASSCPMSHRPSTGSARVGGLVETDGGPAKWN